MEKWSHTDFVGGTFFLVMETGSRMSRKFREWPPDAGCLFPPSPRDWLPEDQLVYFLLDVTGQVDLSPIVDDYGGENGGQSPFHPRRMLVLPLYSEANGNK